MKLTDWNLHILNESGVERIGMEECVVWEDDECTEVMMPRPILMRRGDLWVVRATFDL